ncbi:hypothetical protein glysoja_006775 [Glycine soja]|nr:hypothetical protein glysoja_006775 [Glycine soja]
MKEADALLTTRLEHGIQVFFKGVVLFNGFTFLFLDFNGGGILF